MMNSKLISKTLKLTPSLQSYAINLIKHFWFLLNSQFRKLLQKFVYLTWVNAAFHHKLQITCAQFSRSTKCHKLNVIAFSRNKERGMRWSWGKTRACISVTIDRHTSEKKSVFFGKWLCTKTLKCHRNKFIAFLRIWRAFASSFSRSLFRDMNGYFERLSDA